MRRAVEGGLLVAAVGLHAALVRRYWFVCDDAYISFRYARMWAGGEGLRFNHAGPPVEGFSNPLWVALEAGLHAAGLSLPVVMPLVCLLCSTLLVVGLAWVLREGLALPLLPRAVGLLLVAASPALGVWGSSGLESMALALGVFGAFATLVVSPRSGPAMAFIAAVVLLRSEGVAWAAVLVGVAALARRPVRGPLLALIVTAGASLAVRLWWFGDAMGNTAVAKVAPSVDVFLRGGAYVLGNLGATPAVLVGLVAAVGLVAGRGERDDRVIGLAALAVAGAAVGEAIAVGGDFMAFGRMLLPAWPMVALVAALGLRRAPRPATLLALGLVGLLQGAAVLDALPGQPLARFRGPEFSALSETGMWRRERDQVFVLTEVGQGLAATTSPGSVAVAGALGVVGWEAADLDFVDLYGLVTPDVARREVVQLGLPGHDKAVDHWYFVDRGPDVLFAAVVVGDALRAPLSPFARELQRRSLQAVYAPSLVRLLPDTASGQPRFLFSLRRTETPQAAWDAFGVALDAPVDVPAVQIDPATQPAG
ncbi:MAG: hypothetical protein H6742_11135 [Alphaproteobacteria bacterium]|nr:hypothetical protein [Alphaproteobacteria bacterium]